MRETDLLLGVWREACTRIELEHSLEGIARLIASHISADHLIVREVDLVHGGLDTVAQAPCRQNVQPITAARSDLTAAATQEVLTWCRDSDAVAGVVPGDRFLELITPADFRGECLASPLRAPGGPLGVVMLLSWRSGFAPADRALLARLREPFEVALANTARVREFKRVRESLAADKQALLSKLGRHDVADAVVGAETGLRAVMERVEYVAGTDIPVLIVGETGSGKEVLARALHERSRRARSPLVRVNCGAIPSGLVDSELFGHEPGHFNAAAPRQGWFQRADGGTLFLDEIGELPLEAQSRLTRFLQGGVVERVGGQRAVSVDVRIIAATHRDLRDMVTRGTFRQDLWQRISLFPIYLPPLRERREDIPRLAAHFASRAATRLVGVPLMPTAADIDLLLAYDWPGNVRELAAVIERAVILGAGRTLCLAAALGSAPPGASVPTVVTDTRGESDATSIDSIDAAMRRHIEAALAATGGRIEGARGAARRLGINPHTLRARMRKLGISRKEFRDASREQNDAEQLIAFDEAMARHIRRALEATAGRIEGPHGAARLLGINPHTLRGRMRKLGLVPARFRRESATTEGSGPNSQDFDPRV